MASRSELIQWLNTTLELNYTKVEQCGSGAAYCQLMDLIYGGVPVHKVKFESAHGEYDYRHNFKILQASFTRNHITKVIDVEKLIKCRLQDNLELLQWFRKHWMDNNQGVNPTYEPKTRRKALTGNSTSELTIPKTRGRINPLLHDTPSRNVSTSSVNSVRSSGKASTSGPNSRRSTLTGSRSSTNIIVNGGESNGSRRSIVPSGSNSTLRKVSTEVADDGAKQLMQRKIDTLQSQVNLLTEELKETTVSAESLETERNFYFNKLRDIEILTQNIKDGQENDKYPELTRLTVMEYNDKIQEILYYTEEGFHISETADNMEQDVDIEDEMF
ncbi:uncharacterized protein KQ657_002171 [Scheffersomyces spartinae]|uniref:Uncharacterized protein n=1 Tax=Scheffersomyces spartinae TaxID=45513 RepID=A0A9P7VD70_9ASCO|nr:uncharacterized protein KQ657_002171 [Scheffersomyces spartinae]KAG7195786.1 hypothetical protein KQ657_002171 [Scheffersomyces spartinae]